jgi:starch synthase
MKVLYLASEVAPYASSGEVGESAGALTSALADLGLDVRVALPLYGAVRTVGSVSVGIAERTVEGWLETDGPRCDPRMLYIRNDHYYGRPELYGYEDEAERFLFYSKAALAAVKRIGFRPDIIHCNDWHTGLVPWLLRHEFQGDAFFTHTATVFTVHNLAHQGCFGTWVLGLAGLPAELMRPEQLEYFGQVSFLKAGIVGADLVTALSPNYAREIQTVESGENMHGALAERGEGLQGVLNGIDYNDWDPAHDPAIAMPYDADRPADREANTRVLRGLCDFDEAGTEPIFAVVSPLTTQYGLGAIATAAPEILRAGGRMVILGKGDQFYEGLLGHLQDEHPGRIRVFLEADVPLTRSILAGSHFLLRPSLREPHGALVMAAIRYGCIPIATAAGPLADIVGPAGAAEPRGITCAGATPEALTAAAKEAFAAYKAPARLAALQVRAMRTDFSWAASARAYRSLYERTVERHVCSPVE